MAVLPVEMDRLGEDPQRNFGILERYIRYMAQQIEFSMGNMGRTVSSSGVTTAEVLLQLLDLRNDMGAISSAVGVLTGEVNGMKSTLGELTVTVNGLSSTANSLTANVDGLSATVNALDSIVDGLTTAVNGLTGSVSSLDQRVTALENAGATTT